MPAVTISPDKRARWTRTPGNEYASDSTYEVAVTLASNRRCWDLVEQHRLRAEDGSVDAQGLKALFEPMLDRYRMANSVRASQIDWNEVAGEFAHEQAQGQVEPAAQEAPAAQAREARDIAAGLGVRVVRAREGDPVPAGQTAFPDESDGVDGESESSAEGMGRAIAPEALAVLRRCLSTPEGVFLPDEQLPRKLYEDVNAVFVALGGKWDKKLKGHRFESDPAAVLEIAAATGRYVSPKDFGYFPTPEEVGRRVIEAAELEPGMLVLEPSAGRGALADLASAVVGQDNVHTIELLQSNRRVLESKGYVVYGMDFLAMEPKPIFDRVIMNPPFENLADIDHVRHAAKFLKPDGVLVSITSPGFTFRETKKAVAFRALLEQAGEVCERVDAGAFKESGTGIATVIVKLEAARLPSEFWGPEDERFDGRDDSVARDRQRGG